MVTLLNRHFGLQALAVQEHHGVVDKFVGDSIVAFWGPPFVKTEEHAMLACRAAQAQLSALDNLRRELPDITGLRRDAPAIDLCIGICTGEVVVGNIGSENTPELHRNWRYGEPGRATRKSKSRLWHAHFA